MYKAPTERKDSLSSDKPQPILVKKKSSLLDKKRGSSAKVILLLSTSVGSDSNKIETTVISKENP